MMEALKRINDSNVQSNRKNFEQGMKVLTKQLHTIEERLAITINKEVQREVQYERQDILHVQNTLLSHLSPLL